MATLSPWRFTRETVSYKEAFPIVSKSAQEFSSKFKQRIRPVPWPRWAESNCRFYVSSWVRYGRGKIRVTSQPTHASVYLDGEYRGTTPLTVRRLKVGWHEVAVIKEGYRIYVKDAYVGRGERVYLKTELEKLEN